MIGTESTPPYSGLLIGDVFGENVSVSVGSPHPFGTIEIAWDGTKEATFDTGKDFYLSTSIALSRQSGDLRITGSATHELIVLHFFGDLNRTMELRGKYLIPKTSKIEFDLNL